MSPDRPNLPPGQPLQAYAPNRYRIGAGWEAEVENPGDIFAATFAAGGEAEPLFTLTKQRTSGFFRLLRRLDLKPGLMEIVVCYACRLSHAGLLEQAGILHETSDGERRLLVQARDQLEPAADAAVTATGLVRLDPGAIGEGKLFLALQCGAGPGRLQVEDIHVESFTPNWLDDLVSEAPPRVAAKTGERPHGTGAAPDREPDRGPPPKDPADFFTTRRQILVAADAAAREHRTPYFAALTDAVQMTNDLRILTEAERTLTRVDRDRCGSRPPPEGPLVSVIMPVRNRAGMVGDAVSSVLAQTHENFELLICDDASDDATRTVLERLGDARLQVLRHQARRGAAAARNTCLREARGAYVAYLDSDNLWHPRFLELLIEELQRWPGHSAAYASYFDVQTDALGRSFLIGAAVRPFHLEDQIDSPFVDLNSLVHRRELVDLFGGFDERLVRRQDYDLILRYAWLRPPRHVPVALNLYRRIVNLDQITQVERDDTSAPAIIARKAEAFYASGLPVSLPPWLKKATIVSWDMSRNHFAKAFSVAEALSRHIEVELVSFRFFEEPIFRPLAGGVPSFELLAFDGGEFPDFSQTFDRAVEAVSGDLIYAVKPRLPSLGLALMANFRTGKPIFLEANDLETVVASPSASDRHLSRPLSALLEKAEEARIPHSPVWSQVLDRCAQQLPTVFTHNVNLDIHYGRRCQYMRNVKDQAVYDPAAYDGESVRAELGFAAADRVILFGGLVRRHKGIFELVQLVGRLGHPYRLLIAASRETPDLAELRKQARGRITVLGPQPPERMAALNLAADVVVLWLDPQVPASHYQCPYKLTDALAMGPAIIGSPVGELALLAERDLLWTVPFGDLEGLERTIRAIFADQPERERRRERARQLFLREFSYNAVAPAIALAAARLEARSGVYPIAEEFARTFMRLQSLLK